MSYIQEGTILNFRILSINPNGIMAWHLCFSLFLFISFFFLDLKLRKQFLSILKYLWYFCFIPNKNKNFFGLIYRRLEAEL